jgi:hypothetical protein
MNQFPDDFQIRLLIRRLKQVDEQSVTPFDVVLRNSIRNPRRRPTRQLAMVTIGCGVAALLIAFLSIHSRHRNLVSQPPLDATRWNGPPSDRRLVSVDFDHLRHVLEEHFRAPESTNGASPCVWSSRTESLLALNLNVSLTEE